MFTSEKLPDWVIKKDDIYAMDRLTHFRKPISTSYKLSDKELKKIRDFWGAYNINPGYGPVNAIGFNDGESSVAMLGYGYSPYGVYPYGESIDKSMLAFLESLKTTDEYINKTIDAVIEGYTALSKTVRN